MAANDKLAGFRISDLAFSELTGAEFAIVDKTIAGSQRGQFVLVGNNDGMGIKHLENVREGDRVYGLVIESIADVNYL